MSKAIYFLRPIGARGPIKIGCSSRPLERLRAYGQWSALPLELAALCDGQNHGVERRLHLMFKAAHSHGEWFQPTPELEAMIARVAAGERIEDIIGPTPYPGPSRRHLTTMKTAALHRLRATPTSCSEAA